MFGPFLFARKARDENQSVPISVSNAALSASRGSVFRYSSSNIWQVSIRTSRCIARSRGGTCQCCAIPWDHSIPRNHRRRSLPRMDSGCYGAALWIYGLPCSVRCFAIRLIFPATGKRKTQPLFKKGLENVKTASAKAAEAVDYPAGS